MLRKFLIYFNRKNPRVYTKKKPIEKPATFPWYFLFK